MAHSLLSDKRLWLNAAERAVLTFAQALVAQLAVFQIADIENAKFHGLPWYAMISVALVAALISLLVTIIKGASGTAGAGVDLAPEDVDEPFAHDDFPAGAPEIAEPQPISPEARQSRQNKKL